MCLQLLEPSTLTTPLHPPAAKENELSQELEGLGLLCDQVDKPTCLGGSSSPKEVGNTYSLLPGVERSEGKNIC